MNLSQLRYVVAVVDEGTMTAAAGRLHVAQPAVSQAVRALEAELGVELFRRTGRRLELTEPGGQVVGAARRALAEVDAIPGLAAAASEREQARVAVVSTDKLSAYCTAAAREVGRGRPEARVSLSLVGRADAVPLALRDGTADVGLTHLPIPVDADLEVEVVGEQGFVVVLPPGLTHDRASITRAELAAFPLIAPLRGSRHRAVFDRRFAEVGVEPKIALELDTESRDLSPAVIVATGASFAYRTDAQEFTRLGATVLEFEPPMGRPIAIVRPRNRRSDHATALVDALRAVVAADPAAAPRSGALLEPAAD